MLAAETRVFAGEGLGAATTERDNETGTAGGRENYEPKQHHLDTPNKRVGGWN